MTIHIHGYRVDLTMRPYNRRRRTTHPKAPASRLVGAAVVLTAFTLVLTLAQIGGAL